MHDHVTISLSDRGAAAGADVAAHVTAFVLLWSRHEPHRSGEVALLPGGHPGVTATLGRAVQDPTDTIARIGWAQQRPGQFIPTGPLTDPAVSRHHLHLTVLPSGALQVENRGRVALRHNDLPAVRAVVQPGDTLELVGRLLVLCSRRPLVLPAYPDGLPPPPRHPFGVADPHGIVGESPAVWRLRERIAFVAGRTGHALILGESGTGKELAAQAVHGLSARRDAPLISRNAATLPEGLIDAELFGHAANYPNPGTPERPGLIGAADGGTLFLDEFAELPEAMQAHLLRVLDSGEYHRLGEARPRRADFRLIAATNRPLSALKPDLRARLQLRVLVPPLSARRDDLFLLASHRLREAAKGDALLRERFFPGNDPAAWPRIAVETARRLLAHPWQTHVRELSTLLWDAIAASRGDWIDTPGTVDAPTPRQIRPAAVVADAYTPEELQACLDRNDGAQEPTWRELGLSSRHVLTRLVRKYGLRVRGRTRS